MNYMQDALKKKKTITISLDIDPDTGTAEITPTEMGAEDASPMMEEESGDESKKDNASKGMAPGAPEPEESEEKPMMSEEDIAGEFQNDQPIGKPRSLQEALMKKSQGMKSQ